MFIKLHSFLPGRCVCVGADGSSSGRSASCSRAAAAADRGTKKQMFMSMPRGSTLQEHLFFTFDFITANTDCIEKLQDRIKAAEYRVLSLAPVSFLQHFICVSLKQF